MDRSQCIVEKDQNLEKLKVPVWVEGTSGVMTFLNLHLEDPHHSSTLLMTEGYHYAIHKCQYEAGLKETAS